MEIIQQSNLSENVWLQSILESRFKWVSIYVSHVFSARMSSSQKVESYHAFFKGFVLKRKLLVDFITQFKRTLIRQ